MNILIYKDDQQQGPFDYDTIRDGLASGSFTLEDHAFQDGCEDWVPLHTLLPHEEPLSAQPSKNLDNHIGRGLDKIDSAISQFINEDQDPKVVNKVINRAKELLTRDEVIEYIGVQKKPVVTLAPDAVLLTNKRFTIVRPKLMGMTFEDHMWRNVENVHMSEQMIGATITCSIVGGQQTSINSIPKKQARKVYAYAQEAEERMHEVRRARDMEERRAAAGGVVFHSPTNGSGTGDSNLSKEDPMEVLGKLKKMLDAGLIDQSEFSSKKAELLARM